MNSKRRLITLGRIIHVGTVNFIRNTSLAVAAMAVMVITLTIVLFSLVANATFANTIQQITGKIDVSVFLQDNVTDAQAQQLAAQLRKLPNVKQVEYLNKQQALAEFEQQNPGNTQLVQAANEAGSPIPATIHVFPKDLNQINQIKAALTTPATRKLQTDKSPSYQGSLKEAIDNITHATDVLREIGVIAIIVFAVVSALIIFNTIQMAIFNRRDELQIMRLLGAGTWYIRGPFVVESAIYGLLAGCISFFIIAGVLHTSSSTFQATTLGLLDIRYAGDFFNSHYFALLGFQLLVGVVIGCASSVIATRRYLKFKTK